MIIPGIVSVTFRDKTASEIIALAKEAGLGAVEWGADVHAKPDCPDMIRAVGEATRAAGLLPISYGSYFWVTPETDTADFASVIEAAKLLGASNIRGWAGHNGTADATDDEFFAIAHKLAVCCDMAAEHGLTLSVEYHPNTLTDCNEGAVRLARQVAKDNFRLYWQPDFTKSDDENVAALEAVLPWLGNVHVFSWEGAGSARYDLEHSRDLFIRCASLIEQSQSDHGLLLEFVKGNSPEQMIADAATLADIIK